MFKKLNPSELQSKLKKKKTLRYMAQTFGV